MRKNDPKPPSPRDHSPRDHSPRDHSPRDHQRVYADEVTQYKCPACDGPLRFDAESGRLICEYCDARYAPEEIQKLFRKKVRASEEKFGKDRDAQEMVQAWDLEKDGLTLYLCPSCAGEIICEKVTGAVPACPYCGNPSVVPGQFAGDWKPDYIIPFKVTRDRAIAKLYEHYGRRLLLPRIFIKENHVQEIKGIYVPYWLFNCTVDGRYVFFGDQLSVHDDHRRNERITETIHYQMKRNGTATISKAPADASKKMDDDLMKSLEPFDFKELVPFDTAYLSGFLADKYDMEARVLNGRLADQSKAVADAMFHDEVSKDYINVRQREREISVKPGKTQYALLPVWLLTTKWQDKYYVFAMNGQTGKFVGDLPMDDRRYWLFRLLYAGGLTALFFAAVKILDFII